MPLLGGTSDCQLASQFSQCLQEKDKEHYSEAREHILDPTTYCRKIKPYVYFYKQQTMSLNQTAHHILKNEIDLILPQFPTDRIEKRSIITSLIPGFIRLAYEGISTFLHIRRCIALYKAVKVMETKAIIQHNNLMHLEDSVVVYGIYNPETLEKLIDTVHSMHNITMPNRKPFTGQLNITYMW